MSERLSVQQPVESRNKPRTTREAKTEKQHRKEVMHWKHRMRKLRNYERTWSQY